MGRDLWVEEKENRYRYGEINDNLIIVSYSLRVVKTHDTGTLDDALHFDG